MDKSFWRATFMAQKMSCSLVLLLVRPHCCHLVDFRHRTWAQTSNYGAATMYIWKAKKAVPYSQAHTLVLNLTHTHTHAQNTATHSVSTLQARSCDLSKGFLLRPRVPDCLESCGGAGVASPAGWRSQQRLLSLVQQPASPLLFSTPPPLPLPFLLLSRRIIGQELDVWSRHALHSCCIRLTRLFESFWFPNFSFPLQPQFKKKKKEEDKSLRFWLVYRLMSPI